MDYLDLIDSITFKSYEEIMDNMKGDLYGKED